MPVEIRDNTTSDETFWLEALLWVWDASEFWEIIREDLRLRNYQLVSLGNARNWHHERRLWLNSAIIEQLVTQKAKHNGLLWCEDKVPIVE